MTTSKLKSDYASFVHSGWQEHIDKMILEVAEELKKSDFKYHVEIRSIEEKFGAMVVSWWFADDYYYDELSQKEQDMFEAINNIIRKYEKKSTSICEFCGKKGEVRKINGWYKTTCEEHKGG